MLYNDTSNKTGICQEIDDICGSNTISYPLEAKNRRLNGALDDYVLLAVKEGSGWSVEDTGETDLPIARHNIASGTADTAFPNELLVIEKVEILTSSTGTVYSEISNVEQLDPNAGSGIPREYKKVGNSIILSPTPNYSATLGLRIHYRRGFNYSTLSGSSFTPTSPGIPSVFHMWLARKAALPYLVDKQKANKNDVAALIQEGNQMIISYFGQRPKDVKRRLAANVENNK